MKKEEFIKGIKVLNSAYNTNFSKEDCEIWYEFLKDYDYWSFKEAIKSIIKKTKFMPKISEIIEEIGEVRKSYRINVVVKYMEDRGYFKTYSAKEKTILFINKGIVPVWLKQDIEEYEKEMANNLLTNETKLIDW